MGCFGLLGELGEPFCAFFILTSMFLCHETIGKYGIR